MLKILHQQSCEEKIQEEANTVSDFEENANAVLPLYATILRCDICKVFLFAFKVFRVFVASVWLRGLKESKRDSRDPHFVFDILNSLNK